MATTNGHTDAPNGHHDAATNGHVELPSNIGFIGLGNMGFPMFSNIVSKLPKSSTVHFFDVMPQSMERGLHESGAVANLDPCNSSREVAEKSVRP